MIKLKSIRVDPNRYLPTLLLASFQQTLHNIIL